MPRTLSSWEGEWHGLACTRTAKPCYTQHPHCPQGRILLAHAPCPGCARDMPATPQHGQPRAHAASCPRHLHFTGTDITCSSERAQFFTAAAHLKVSKELSLSHWCQELIHHALFAIELNHWCNWKRQWWKQKGRTAGWYLLQKKLPLDPKDICMTNLLFSLISVTFINSSLYYL